MPVAQTAKQFQKNDQKYPEVFKDNLTWSPGTLYDCKNQKSLKFLMEAAKELEAYITG